MDDPPHLVIADTVRCQLTGVPARPWEVGGWLLGYWTEQRDALFVTHATPPAGRGTPFGVWISGVGHRARFDEAWQASGGVVTFLGDWHTHPGGPASPSARDRDAARQLAEREEYRTPEPLLAISAIPRWRHGRTPRHTRWWLRGREGTLREIKGRACATLPHDAAAVPQWPWPTAARVLSATSANPQAPAF
jgi:integrative and conjugative element protein (TIGR02256 family)